MQKLNKQAIDINNAPSRVDGNFSCTFSRLTTLDGAPQYIGGDFYCYRNLLSSLKGAPSHVGGDFVCFRNQLTSLKDIHKQVKFIGGELLAQGNPIASHVLGLLLIDGLKRVEIDNKKCQKIINTHLGKGKRGMFDAQQEMIEAGFPEMAKL